MKTTLEIPDALFRRAQSAAVEKGISLRELVSEALAEKLCATGYANKPWLATFESCVVCVRRRRVLTASWSGNLSSSSQRTGSDSGYERPIGDGGRRPATGAASRAGSRDRAACDCAGRIPVWHPAVANRARYERWLLEVIASCRVLTVDEGTAGQYAEVRDELKWSGCPMPGNDLWIAALARQHSMPLLSRDQHFDFVPKLRRIGW
jgi:PIN domain